MKYFIYLTIGIVVAASIAGMVLVGPPGAERARRIDRERVSHLHTLQQEILFHWQRKGTVPAQLAELADPIRGFQVPLDPETKKEYDYRKKSDASFELCANFSRPGGEDGNNRYPNAVQFMPKSEWSEKGSWQHGSGMICFNRTIDKELFKPFKDEHSR